MMIMLNSTRGICSCVPVGLPWPWSVRNRVSNSESTLLATKFATWLAARLAAGSQQGRNHARQHPKQHGWQQGVNGRLASGEAFRRMSCRMFRVHRVVVSRDSARPAARYWGAAETVRMHGVTRALLKLFQTAHWMCS